ncbi:MAG: hypothetical protein ACOZQL_40630 [Myxococcota bacterium]
MGADWAAVAAREDERCVAAIPSAEAAAQKECEDPASARCAQFWRYAPEAQTAPVCTQRVEAVSFTPDARRVLLVLWVAPVGKAGEFVLFAGSVSP